MVAASLATRAVPTGPAASPPQTFADGADRARLTPAALAGLRSVALAWRLGGGEAADLLGVSPSTWDRIRAGTWKQALSQDQLTRVSAVVGTYKALHLLFAGAMADRWVRLRNKGPLFGGATPVEAMRERGIPGMIEIRHHVDALRGGL